VMGSFGFSGLLQGGLNQGLNPGLGKGLSGLRFGLIVWFRALVRSSEHSLFSVFCFLLEQCSVHGRGEIERRVDCQNQIRLPIDTRERKERKEKACGHSRRDRLKWMRQMPFWGILFLVQWIPIFSSCPCDDLSIRGRSIWLSLFLF